jgi:hypothetical protein
MPTIEKLPAILDNDTEMKNEDEDLENYKEVELQGIFIKHDFDHIILNENEVEKYTRGNLTYSTLKQTLFVPYEYDI